MNNPFTIWFTGLPCSGKSTLANYIGSKLYRLGLDPHILDGDEVRENLTSDLGFSKEDRLENIKRNSYVAGLLETHGVIPIGAFITPYREGREVVRSNVDNCKLVYVKCPVEVCAQRDVKGMYEKAKRGEIENFTGISDPFEEPNNPDVVVESHKEDELESVDRIIEEVLPESHKSLFDNGVPHEQSVPPPRTEEDS